MFLGDRRVLIERVILAGNTEERDEALAALLPLQRKDFAEILDAMDGLPVTIRLLDPPLHEFLPDRTELAVKVALAEAAGQSGPQVDADRKVLAAVERLHESNPMLGFARGAPRPADPGLFALQVRAIAEAMSDQIAAGKNPKVEIMVPLVGSVMELHLVRDETERILTEVGAERGVTLTVPVGTMIELPRAALTAHRIADAADFFSFGTNDLTQTTWGFSRDDVESTVFAAYLEKGVSPSPRSRPSTPTASGGWWRSRPRRAERPSRTSSSGSAASTVAIRSPSTSSTAPGWTTCPAHRSGCRSPASRPAGPPWAELPAAQRSRCGRGQRRQRRQQGGCDGARGRFGPRQGVLAHLGSTRPHAADDQVRSRRGAAGGHPDPGLAGNGVNEAIWANSVIAA